MGKVEFRFPDLELQSLTVQERSRFSPKAWSKQGLASCLKGSDRPPFPLGLRHLADEQAQSPLLRPSDLGFEEWHHCSSGLLRA